MNASDPRHAIVVVFGPDRRALLGVDPHRAKLAEREQPAVLADALLAIEDRPARFEADGQRRQQHDRPGDDDPDERTGHVEQPLEEPRDS